MARTLMRVARFGHTTSVLCIATQLLLACAKDTPAGGRDLGQGGSGSPGCTNPSEAADPGPSEAQCDAAAPPWSGPLCGPPDRPCQLVADETLPALDGWRNDAPSLAVARGY